jgi:glycogen debranching enzyme
MCQDYVDIYQRPYLTAGELRSSAALLLRWRIKLGMARNDAKTHIIQLEDQFYIRAESSLADDRTLVHPELASSLRVQAGQLRRSFSTAFWSDELGMFALALDGNKRQCGVRSSNAGQCLFSGIGSKSQTLRTIESLLSPGVFSGWGIRTIATEEKRYNPMSYHNGSVWPHDNAMIAFGVRAPREIHGPQGLVGLTGSIPVC